ncbi:hypothetical protein QBC39DRAFT_51094 [Podospora conica]|nr:hypothetical protein QBC39DRAFT_51094 [Schizothecium conicum]
MSCYCANYYVRPHPPQNHHHHRGLSSQKTKPQGSIGCRNTVSKFGERCKLCVALKSGASMSNGLLDEDDLWMVPDQHQHQHQQGQSQGSSSGSGGGGQRGWGTSGAAGTGGSGSHGHGGVSGRFGRK